MGSTVLTIEREKFKINGRYVYEEIVNANPKIQGTLMNMRCIQGIFDSENRMQFNRYGKNFDPDINTKELIAALPQWYEKGIRAITVGLQGGGNCFTIKGSDLQNNPFSSNGEIIKSDYLERLDQVIRACDQIGIVVIVSYFYCQNIEELKGSQAVINIVKGMTAYLNNQGYTNIIIEIANEYDLNVFSKMPIIKESQGMVALLNIAKQYAGDIPIGCSGQGGTLNQEVCEASDVILIHGNGESRTQLYNHIIKAKEYAPHKPIVINEDSQAIGQLTVCEELGVSWGYYNNMTKQEVPVCWEITKGEDQFFAWRLAHLIGIRQEEIPVEEQYYFQGFEPYMHHHNIRFPRIASLYPESINFVRFYKNDELEYVCYDECFTLKYCSNWKQLGVQTQDGDIWRAEIVLRDGSIKNLIKVVENK